MAEKENNNRKLLTAKEAEQRRKNYFHPIKGAWDRWKSSLENNTNPVKAVLDHGLASFIPGLNIGQAIYSAAQSYNNLTSDNGVKKTERLIKEKDPKAILSLIGDAMDISGIAGSRLAANDLAERTRKAMYLHITPVGYGNRFPGDTSRKRQYFNWAKEVMIPSKIDTDQVPRWKTMLQDSPDSREIKVVGLNKAAIAEFRDQAYRKTLRLNPRDNHNNSYIDNPDGSVSYDEGVVNKIRKEYGADPIDIPDGWAPNEELPKYLDYVTQNGGWVDKVTTPDGVYMVDRFDLHPFKDDRSAWKWGSKHVPIIKGFNASKLLQMDDFLLKHKVK